MVVALLGMGRLGRSLAGPLAAAGHEVKTWTRGQPFPTCDVAWVLVSDRAVAEVAAALPPGPVVLHAAGSLDLEVLAPHARRGSIHPIQSFPGPERAMPPLRGVPAAVAGDPMARRIAEDLGFRTFEVPGDRAAYHAAAVMAGNLSIALLDAATQLLAQAGAPPDPSLLAPLALASIRQAAEVGTAAALTGPVARGDAEVVARHLAAMDDPELVAIYTALTRRAEALAGRRVLPAPSPDERGE